MRKIWIAVVVALLVLAAGWVLLRGGGGTNTAITNPTIVAFGDSVTEGVGASAPENNYVSRLSRIVGQDIINQGVSGDTTGSALARVDDVINLDPDIVLVFLGGNDALGGLSAAAAKDNLVEIVTRIQGAGATVILLGLTDGAAVLAGYGSVFSDVVDETGVESVPNFFNGILGNFALLADPIHPNDTGYAVLAERVESKLKEVIASL